MVGTQTLLDAAKNHWKVDPKDKYSNEYKPGVKYLQVSTDEVYGALGKEGMFRETDDVLFLHSGGAGGLFAVR